jgi:hypothetical protein
MSNFARGGTIVGAATLVMLATVLVVAPPASASVSATYSCAVPVLSAKPFTVPVQISGYVTKHNPARQPVKLTGVQYTVTVPGSLVALAEMKGFTWIAGTAKTMDINATDAVPTTVNAAGSGIAVPKTNLPKPPSIITVKLPGSGGTVTGWTAGSTPGQMVFTDGNLDLALTDNLGKTIAVTCAAKPPVTIASTTVSITDTGDHFSVPAGTGLVVQTKAGTGMQFAETVNGTPMTVTCTNFIFVGTTGTGLTITSQRTPIISSCTDSLGGNDSVAANQTNGTWQLTEIDSTSETGTEPNKGDKMSLTIPQAGAVFRSSKTGSCAVTLAPTGPAVVLSAMDDATTMIVSNASIPASGAGCTSNGSSVMTATLVLNKAIHDV